MNDNNELIPIIIDFYPDNETINQDNVNINIIYDTDNILILLNDITGEIIINIQRNSIPIHITILNNFFSF